MAEQQRISQLQESLKGANALIKRLSKLQFQEGSADADTERVELGEDIHESLKALEEEYDLLRQDIEDLKPPVPVDYSAKRRESDRQRKDLRLSIQCTRFGEELSHSRNRFRSAQLSAKRASDKAKSKERDAAFVALRSSTPNEQAAGDLFSTRRPKKEQKPLSKAEAEAQASTDVTAALRRTHALLSTELSRSRFAQETFEESSAALQQLGDTYTDLSSALDKSKDILSTLLRSQKSDTWYLETAFYILLATLCWLFFRRILYGPFFKLPLFLWRLTYLFIWWLFIKPFLLFLTLTGVLTKAGTTTSIAQSRAPLIVQPSASGGIPKINMEDRERIQRGGGVPVGGGGAGAKLGKDGSLLDKIGNMVGIKDNFPQQKEGENVVRRGDGTILQERGDIPKNPKKKTFETEAPVEQDERVKRDEL
ncbi:hypothetical protein K470DRAFT_260824, partial [Piedraia hortae CBS 480.64]